MEKPIHIQVLELLYQNGIGKPMDVSTFIINHFSYPTPFVKENNVDLAAGNVLTNLAERDFIKSNKDLSNINWLTEETDEMVYVTCINGVDWTKELPYFITSNGVDYLDKYYYSLEQKKFNKSQKELNESYKDVNKASLTNYTIQKWGTGITIFLALIAATFSTLEYFKPEPKMVELNKNIQSLSKELAGIKQQIDSLQNQIASPADSSRKR